MYSPKDIWCKFKTRMKIDMQKRIEKKDLHSTQMLPEGLKKKKKHDINEA